MTKIDVQKKRGGAIRGTKWSSVHTLVISTGVSDHSITFENQKKKKLINSA
jgi:hypothetical protein